MILEVKKWCEGIIVAVFWCIIIESLIPNGNSKKYIKVVIGIYIMYVSLNPLLNLLNYDFDFKMFENYAKYEESEEVSVIYENNIKDIYVLGIEECIENDLKNMGYEIDDVKVFVDLNYENIEMIELKIKNVGKLNENQNRNQIVREVVINNEGEIERKDDISEIREYISTNYLVKKENIIIKEEKC